MWLKITLLLIYLSVLFLLARLLEAIAWYEHGQLSRSLLDPMTLSVLKLKALLEQRGISYDNVVEKLELTELVEASGAVTEGEAEMSSVVPLDESAVVNYTGAADFYEQVEDAKDSMWLVEVLADSRGVLSYEGWKSIRKKVDKFGVRFGRLDCQLDIRLCTRKAWFTSRLVLALPENHRTKANVAIHTYPGPIRINSLSDWIKSKVSGQIRHIDSHQTFRNDWLTYPSNIDPEVRVILVSTLSTVPLFLSALAVKFPGRVKIGNIDTKTETGKTIAKKSGITNIPSYVVVTQEHMYFYGYSPAEYFNFRAMELFLKSLHPNVNDLFIVSILFTNIASFFEFSLSQGTIWKRFINLLISIFKYNIVLLLVWIVLLGVFSLSILENFSLWGLKVIRLLTSSFLFSLIRSDILLYSRNWMIPIMVFTIMIFVTWFMKSKYHGGTPPSETDFWNFSNMATLDYEQAWELSRLRPFDQIFNPSVVGISYFVNVLDHDKPYVNKDYIKHLPTWHYEVVRDDQKAAGMKKGSAREHSRKTPKSKRRHSSQTDSKSSDRNTEEDDTNRLVTSVMDSNYRCECDQICDCPRVSPRRNPDDVFDNQISDSVMEHGANNASNKEGQEEKLNRHKCKPAGFLEGTQCVICLENYIPGVLLRGLPCFHAFHDECILTWLTRDNHFCPVCRWQAYKPKQHSFHTENLHDE